MQRYDSFSKQRRCQVRNDRGAIGMIPYVQQARVNYWAINAFWLGVSLHWAAFLTIAMTAARYACKSWGGHCP